MLDGSDRETFFALRLLRDVVAKDDKPVIFWIGAGAICWRGYPSWKETAEELHKEYSRFEGKYDKSTCRTLIDQEKFPELFEVLRNANTTRYNRKLASLFGPRAPTPVYNRFVDIGQHIAPLYVVTTNVDESLESSFPAARAVQRTDLEICLDFLNAQTPFIAKLHGSISSIGSVIFTAKDYELLLSNSSYTKSLQALFLRATVVFIGYGLRDDYVVRLFQENSSIRALFGDGPHFAVTSGELTGLPESVKKIRYMVEPFSDHRSAITVLDIIRVVRDGAYSWISERTAAIPASRKIASAYFVSDITPPGTWANHQSLTLLSKAGLTRNAIVGQGFTDSEFPQKTSPVLHDLTVGLICFDHIYVPLSCAAKLHEFLSPDMFWTLVVSGVFRFIHFRAEPTVMFRSESEVSGGDIGTWALTGDDGQPLTVDEQIRRQIRAVPGREAQADELFDRLKSNMVVFDEEERFKIPSLTRGALLHPSVKQLLGISDAVTPTNFPRWVTFPVLRLAHTIMAGCACDNFELPATKIGFGGEILVGAAFAVAAARDWADSVSSYVLTSRFNTDLGAYVSSNLGVFTSILRLRDTPAGTSLRREILEEIALNAGSEFVASVNAGLRQVVPTSVMDGARDELSGLLFRKTKDAPLVPAVWTNIRNSDAIAKAWRARSRAELDHYCRTFGIRRKDQCPCGSGEKLRDCCALALRA